MAQTIPTTRSPGKIGLVYLTTGLQHKAHVWTVAGTSLETITTMRSTAVAMALAARQCLPAASTILGWEIVMPDGHIGYSENFPAPYAGTHTTVAGLAAFVSRTVCLSGRGIGADLNTAHGQIKYTLFCSNAFPINPSQKALTVGSDAGLSALYSFFHTNVICFADFYGQHGEPNPLAPIQSNAYYQKKYGN